MQRQAGALLRLLLFLQAEILPSAFLKLAEKEPEGPVRFFLSAGAGPETDMVVFRDVGLQKRIGNLKNTDAGVLGAAGGMDISGIDEDKITHLQLKPCIVHIHFHASRIDQQNLQAVMPVSGDAHAGVFIGKAPDLKIRLHDHIFMDGFPGSLNVGFWA